MRAGIGWIMGTVGAAATIGPTLYACATRFFEFDTLAALGLVAGVGQLFGALPVAGFAVLCGDPGRHSPPAAAARIGAAWVASELLRAVAFTGLPWAFLSHALAPVPEPAGAASARVGFTHQCAGAIRVALLGALATGSAVPMAACIFAGAVISVACFVLIVPKPAAAGDATETG